MASSVDQTPTTLAKKMRIEALINSSISNNKTIDYQNKPESARQDSQKVKIRILGAHSISRGDLNSVRKADMSASICSSGSLAKADDNGAETPLHGAAAGHGVHSRLVSNNYSIPTL